MDNNNGRMFMKVALVCLILILVGIGAYFGYNYYTSLNNQISTLKSDKSTLETNVNDLNTSITRDALISDTKPLKIYNSKYGFFSVNLPAEAYVYEEKPVNNNVGGILGQVTITFKNLDVNDPNFRGFDIVYSSPVVEGKGGGCDSTILNQGTAKLFGQSVSVCFGRSVFNAQYFTNPNRKMEYWIDGEADTNMTTAQLNELVKDVVLTLKFN